MNNFAITLYTHTDCKDVYDIFFKQLNTFFNIECKKYIFINHTNDNDSLKTIPKDFEIIFYDDSQPYTNRLSSCLSKVSEKIILYIHEDMFLYENIDTNEFIKYVNYIENQNRDSFIKLIKGGEKRDIPNEVIQSLKRIPIDSEWIFSVQPSIWKKNALEFIINSIKNCDIYQLENYSQEFCKKNGIQGSYSYQNEKERGGHFDCAVFPYIATAIIRGKWNLKEYPDELGKILLDNNINIEQRGRFI
jgi:hypothetical protein